MGTLGKALLGLRLAGLPNSLRALRYEAWRRRLDALHVPVSPDGALRVPGKLLSTEPSQSGLLLRFENTSLEVRFLAPDMVFLSWDDAGILPSYAVEKPDWSPVTTSCERRPGAWRVGSGSLDVLVAEDGGIRILDAEGHSIREQDPPAWRGRGWSLSSPLPVEARVSGLGNRAAPLDLRRPPDGSAPSAGPRTYRLWNRDPGGAFGPGADPLYISMPVLLTIDGTGCHLVFHDDTFDGTVSVGPRLEVAFTDGPCRAYVAAGSPASVLSRFTELTGRPPLPPLWALRYQQSQWGYGSLREMRRIFRGFRERGLPLGAMVMDIDHMRGFRVFTTDGRRYPDLPAFCRELEAAGTRLVAIVDPGVKRDPGYGPYGTGLAEGAFCRLPDKRVFEGVAWPGRAAFPDFTDPRARAWWGRQYAADLDDGVAGFWHDMNEPACFASSGEPTFPLCVRHALEGRGGDHREAHNVYGMLMDRAGYEGLRALRPERRPFLLSRSGWAGMQRWAWTWTGDVETSWAALRATLAEVLHLGLSGVPYAGPDIGGFSGAPSPELFLRWFQLASLLPFFRTHCAFYLPRREPWSFGPEVLEAVRSRLQARERLLPYLYTLAREASDTGCPLVRPMFWEDFRDPVLRGVEDQFLLGRGLLAAPVLREGAREREVTLPEGGWYETASGRFFRGPGKVRVEAGLDALPVFARAGAVVPERSGDRLCLKVYMPEEDGAGDGVLYSDAGEGYGPGRTDRFLLGPSGNGERTLSWTVSGDFPFPYASTEVRAFRPGAGEPERLAAEPGGTVRIRS